MDQDSETSSLHDLLHNTALDRRILPPDLAAPDTLSYLDHLISLPLATLNREPALISAEATSVESELTNLCYREYPTFLSVHRCSAAVKSAFDDFQHSLDDLLDSVPDLEDECRSFAKRTQGLSLSRNRSIVVQENQDKLLDLLELPRLMETCVRNGYYQEAMELASHAKSLQQRYDGNRLVNDIAREVDGVSQLMLAQLFSILREPVSLSTAMKTVSFLRRMDVMDEESLGLAFLSGRLHNFRNQLLQIEKDRNEPVRYLRKYIDLFREHVYDILSQHSAMFDDFDGLVSFAGQCVTDLVQLVHSYVPRMSSDPASLSSILIQLGYCSLSFARVGIDFAPLIAAPFADTVVSAYSHAVAAASERLNDLLQAASKGHGVPTDALIDVEHRTAILSSPPTFTAESDSPPHDLATFPPIAAYVNDNIAGLNALRLLAPTASATLLAGMLAKTLAADTGAVLAFLRDAVMSQETSVNDTGRPTHKRTPSSPRAQLLRRNTETQLSPAARAAKRHESRQMGLIIADVWLGVVEFLFRALTLEVLMREDLQINMSLRSKTEDLRAWVTAHRVSEDGASDNPAPGAAPSSPSSVSLGVAPSEHTELANGGHQLKPDNHRALHDLAEPVVSVDPSTTAPSSGEDDLPTADEGSEQVDLSTQNSVSLDLLGGPESRSQVGAADLATHSDVVEPMFSAISTQGGGQFDTELALNEPPIIAPRTVDTQAEDVSPKKSSLVELAGGLADVDVKPDGTESNRPEADADLHQPDHEHLDSRGVSTDVFGPVAIANGRDDSTTRLDSAKTEAEDVARSSNTEVHSGTHSPLEQNAMALPSEQDQTQVSDLDTGSDLQQAAPVQSTSDNAVADISASTTPQADALSATHTPENGSEDEGAAAKAEVTKPDTNTSGTGIGKKKKKKKRK